MINGSVNVKPTSFTFLCNILVMVSGEILHFNANMYINFEEEKKWIVNGLC